MLSGEFYFLFIIFNLILASIIININTSLHLILTAEFLWITLYAITLTMGVGCSNLNFMSLTFLFLILSAVEFSIGLVLTSVQFIINRSVNLNNLPYNSTKFVGKFFMKLNLNRIVV